MHAKYLYFQTLFILSLIASVVVVVYPGSITEPALHLYVLLIALTVVLWSFRKRCYWSLMSRTILFKSAFVILAVGIMSFAQIVVSELFSDVGAVQKFAVLKNFMGLVMGWLILTLFTVLFRNLRELLVFIKILCCFVLILSVVGILQKISGNSEFPGLFGDLKINTFFSFFGYENNFGFYATAVLPLIISVSHIEYDTHMLASNKSLMTRTFCLINSPFAFYLFASIVVAAAVFISDSRFCAFVLILYLILELFGSMINRRWPILLMSGAALIGATLFIITATDSDFFSSYSAMRINSSFADRADLFKGIIQGVLDRPMFGWGFGAFEYISRLYVHSYQEHVRHIHVNNEYLELLIEFGIIGLFLIALFALPCLAQVLFKKRNDHFVSKHIYHACLFSLLIIMVNIMSDSHLRVYSCSFLFAVLLGILFNITEPENAEPDKKRPVKQGRYLGLLFIVLMLASLSFWSLELMKNIVILKSKRTVNSVTMDKGSKIFGYDPKYWNILSRIKFKEFEFEQKHRQTDSAAVLLDSAILASKNSIELSRRDDSYYYWLGQLLWIRGDYDESIRTLEEGLKYSPNNKKLLICLISAAQTAKSHFKSMTKSIEFEKIESKYFIQLMNMDMIFRYHWLKEWSIVYDESKWVQLAEKHGFQLK